MEIDSDSGFGDSRPMLRPRKKYTVHDLQQLKGKRCLTHIHVKSPEEATAAWEIMGAARTPLTRKKRVFIITRKRTPKEKAHNGSAPPVH